MASDSLIFVMADLTDGTSSNTGTTHWASDDYNWASSGQVGEGEKKCFIIKLYLAMFTLFTGLNITQECNKYDQ